MTFMLKAIYYYIFLLFVIFYTNASAQLTFSTNLQDAYCACNGSATVTIISGVAPYSYTLNGTPTSTNVFTSLCAGSYTLFVQDSNVPIPDTVTIVFSISDSTFKNNLVSRDGCNSKASATINLSGGVRPYSYTIQPLNITHSLPSFTLPNLYDGTYTVQAIDNAGCTLTNTFAVNNYSAIANFTMSANNAKVGSTIIFTNTSQYASTYLWDFGNGNTATSIDAAETYTTQGIYKVQLIASFGTCSDTSYKWLIITDKLFITIPNIFTPNDDGINDLWYVSFEGAVDMQLEIFNRYGVKLYENKGTGIWWDGRTLAGEPVPTGTYFYSLEVIDVLGEVHKYNGYITLLR